MSAEEAHLMEQEEGNDDSGYDVVLILKNIEIYPMEDVITANKLRKRFQRIFKLDEKTEKGEIIQKIEYSFESFISFIQVITIKKSVRKENSSKKSFLYPTCK